MKRIKDVFINYKKDISYKLKITILVQLIIDIIFFLFELILGIYYKSYCFLTLAAYYLILLILRFVIFKYEKNNTLGENLNKEYKIFKISAYVLLIMNIINIGLIILTFSDEQIINYHEYLIYGLAAFTFYSTIMTIIQIIKYKKYNSPIILLYKIISLFSSVISLLSLEIVMLNTFGSEDSEISKWRFIGITGLGIVILFISISIYMIVLSKRRINKENMLK